MIVSTSILTYIENVLVPLIHWFGTTLRCCGWFLCLGGHGAVTSISCRRRHISLLLLLPRHSTCGGNGSIGNAFPHCLIKRCPGHAALLLLLLDFGLDWIGLDTLLVFVLLLACFLWALRGSFLLVMAFFFACLLVMTFATFEFAFFASLFHSKSELVEIQNRRVSKKKGRSARKV